MTQTNDIKSGYYIIQCKMAESDGDTQAYPSSSLSNAGSKAETKTSSIL